MKIDDTSGILGAQDAQNIQKVTPAFDLFKAYGASPTAGSTGVDQANMSVQAREIQKYTEKLQALPDIREDKVSQLEARLETGEYTVAADAISEMMFRMAELDS